jgi:hypothetical protein
MHNIMEVKGEKLHGKQKHECKEMWKEVWMKIA